MWWYVADLATAATLTVGPAQSYPTIGAAIGAASSGDDIVVDPGTFPESLDLDGKDLTIRSSGGAGVTVLAPAHDYAVRYDDAEDGVLEGFTIRPGDGRAVLEIVGGSPTLRDLVIDGAGRGAIDGGAIRIDGGSALLEDLDILDPVGQRGGALYVVGGAEVTVDGLTVSGATAGWGGGLYVEGASVTGSGVVLDSPVTTWSGAGMYLDDGARVDLDDLSITDASGTWAHGVGAYLRAGSTLHVSGGEISGCGAVEADLGYDGGAVWLDDTSSLALVDVDLVGNSARYGGAISTAGGSVLLDGVSLIGNHALLDGGALVASTQATVTTVGATFDANTAVGGGAIRLSSEASLLDTASVLSTNVASGNGGAISADGADQIVLDGTLLFANEAFGAGGALWASGVAGGLEGDEVVMSDNRTVAGDGGAIGLGADTPLTLTGGSFERNRSDAGDGGAISVSATFGPADVRLVGVALTDNSADRGGGALLAEGADEVELTDAVLMRNVAGTDGGGWLADGVAKVEVVRTLVHGNVAIGRGGGSLEDGTVEPSLYANVTFTENTAVRGGGLALRDAAEAEITNVTFAGNRAQIEGGHLHVQNGTVRLVNTVLAFAVDGGGAWGDTVAAAGSDVFYGIAFANAGGSWVGDLNDPVGSGNLVDDPLFRAFSIDGNEANDDLRLGLGSPAIDFGDPSLADVDGSRSDIGAWGGPNGFRIDADEDGIYAHADCDDADPTVSPVAIEIPYDGVDQDCDGIDPTDLDADGFPGGPDGVDCDDGDAAVNPVAAEIWYDGADQNCDERSDYDADLDGDDAIGFGGPDCDDTDPEVGPSNREIWYDGFDQDCSGGSDYDRDLDGRDIDLAGGTDCDDGDPTIYGGAPEVCDHEDNDCNGLDDDEPVDPSTFWVDADGDGYGDANAWDTACWAGAGLSDNDDDCDDGEAGIHPGVVERWYDGIDQDCDGKDDDRDGDGWLRADECDDARAEAYPGAPELPNGLDDDCDGWAETDDRDGDGLVDWDEWQLGTDHEDADSDDDGLVDGAEVPDPTSAPDTDGDGQIDPLDQDDDGDGILTVIEIAVDVDDDGYPDLDVDDDGAPNHLDLDTDGDSFADADEGTRDRDGDSLADFADYTGPFAGGGCSGGCSGTGTSPSWLLLLVPFVLRRRSVLAALAIPGVAAAQAEEGLDAHGYDLFATTADPRGGSRLTEGGQSEPGMVMGLVVDQANRPVVEELPSGPDPLIEHLTTANVVLSLTPLDRLRIEAVMPVHALGIGTAGTFSTTGDLRIGAQVAIANRGGSVPGLSLLGSAWIPTGNEGRYVGSPDVGAGGGLALSQRIGKFGWSLNGGVRISPERERRGVLMGPGPFGGFGVHFAPAPELALLAELAVDGVSGWSALDAVPIEAMGGIRGRGDKGRFWTLTAGAGLTDAVGASTWRVALGGGFGPKVEHQTLYVEAPQPVAAPEPLPAPPPQVIVINTTPPLAELVDDRIVVQEQVFFEEAKAVILPESEDVLDAVRQVLDDHPEIKFLLIEGHTNHNGTAEYNYGLSRDRAEAVRAWLIAHGIDRHRLLADGFGFDRPLLPPSAPNAYQVNRRVEFVVVRPDEDEDDDK